VTGSGAEVLEIGSSDWVVVPRSGNAYADDEEYFLRCILWFVEQALRAAYAKLRFVISAALPVV